jgi:hypothetical protein
MIIASAGIALQDALKSRRFLVAIVTPWLLFFLIPTQIHERYLLFAAASAAVCIGYNSGIWLLGLLLTGVTTIMMLHVMLISGKKPALNALLHEHLPSVFADDNLFAYTLLRAIQGTNPDIAWGLILIGGIFLFITVVPLRQSLIDLRAVESEDA